jgi:hypothetical protein
LWVLGFGPKPPTPNPQSPIPNPQSPFEYNQSNNLEIKNLFYLIIIKNINNNSS